MAMHCTIFASDVKLLFLKASRHVKGMSFAHPYHLGTRRILSKQHGECKRCADLFQRNR
jgi:hypothetical protein